MDTEQQNLKAKEGGRPSFYFDQFEDRQPPPPLPYSPWREALFQFLATINLVLGGWYIWWRWAHSLNYDAMWFSVPLVVAETLAYIGMVLFSLNLWFDREFVIPDPPESIDECEEPSSPPRPISVDVFFPTYSEEPDLVRLSILDAKKISYPHPIDIKIHVLDDGQREEMKQVAQEEEVNYLTRSGNAGFKAGNIQQAMERTTGDFIVICDADTRPFPTILAHTLGYFRDPDVAWVQTPQWFFDIPMGERLSACWKRKAGRIGQILGKAVELVYGPTTVGEDPFGNDAKLFYEVILKRRDPFNASFCCGAGSIHRREAVMQAALRRYADTIEGHLEKYAPQVEDEEIREAFTEVVKREMIEETPVTPYMFHVSEDIYTSLMLHSDPTRNWRSILHPQVESKMLSPQDLHTWMVQRFKYAAGSLDIMAKHNPITMKGLTLGQRLMYGLTFYSYLSAVWNLIFLLAPVVYLLTGIAPVSAYSVDFIKHLVPFLLMNRLVLIVGTWGIDNWRSEQFFTAFFATAFQAIGTVLKGKTIKFPVTSKERQEGNFLYLVRPQIALVVLTLFSIVFASVRVALGRESDLPGLIVNAFWALNNVLLVMGVIKAAMWRPVPQLEEAF